jgi:hypothetical protein
MRAKYQRFLVRWRSVRPGGTLVTTWGTSRRATLGLYAAATQFLHRWDTAAADESAWGAVPALLLVLPPSRSPNPACGSHRTGLSMVPAGGLVRPTVKLGLHLRYPPTRTHRHMGRWILVGRCVTVRWRIFRHYSLQLCSFPRLLGTTAALRAVTGSPGPHGRS